MSRKGFIGALMTLALAFGLLLSAAPTAEACPQYTVPIERGSGVICKWRGLYAGKYPDLSCSRKSGACPSGTRENSASSGKFCCPTSYREAAKPKGSNCRIDGTAPFCDGECRNGETVRYFARKTMGCATGRKVQCCR